MKEKIDFYFIYISPVLWLGIGIWFAADGESWGALIIGMLSGIKLLKAARSLGRSR